MQALVQQRLQHYGKLDDVFNNAGTETRLGFFTDTTIESLEDVLAASAKSTLLAQGRGIVVNTGHGDAFP